MAGRTTDYKSVETANHRWASLKKNYDNFW